MKTIRFDFTIISGNTNNLLFQLRQVPTVNFYLIRNVPKSY